MIDAAGHTIRDPRDELVAAQRSLIATQEAGLRGVVLDMDRERVRLAERALVEAPAVRAVAVVVMEATSHACGSWAGVEAADRGCDLPVGTRATLLVPVRP